MTTRYDSNVQLLPDGQSDMVYVIGPQVGMKYQGTNMDVTASYGLQAELFANHHNLNQVLQNLSLDTDFGRMLMSALPKGSTFHVHELMSYTPTLPNFQSLVTPSPGVTTGGVITPLTRTFTNVFGIDDTTPLSTLTRIEVAYSNSYTNFQDPSLIDTQTNHIQLSVGHDVSRTDVVTTGYSYSRVNAYGGPITHLHSISVGDKHEFSPIMTGTVEGGAVAMILPDQNRPEFSAQGSLSISRQFKEQVRLNARVSQETNTFSGIVNTALITDTGALSLSRQFTPSLGGEVSVNVARNYSTNAEKRTGVLIDIRSQGASLGLHYQVTSWLLSDLTYGYLRQETFGSYQDGLIDNQCSFTLRAKWS